MNYKLMPKLLSLCFFFGLFSQTTLVANYYCPKLTSNNVQTVSDEISDYYKNIYGGSDLLAFQLELQQLFLELNLHSVDDASCNRGELVSTGYEEFQDGDFSTRARLNLRWGDSSPLCQQYYNGYLDLVSLQRWDTTMTVPGATYNLPESSQWKLLVLNARCELTQSAYYIIIVDRDLNLSTLDSGGHGGSNGHGSGGTNAYRLKSNDAKPSLLVSPNPLTGKSSQVSFNLNSDQNISLYLIDGSTGRLVKSLFSDQPFREGEHKQLIMTEALITGFYYVILQTNSERIVKKLIKI